MTSIYQFTQNSYENQILNQDRPKNTIPLMCLLSSKSTSDGEDNKSFRDCIVVAYRESWCDSPSDSIQYQNYKVGNRLMNRRDNHFKYYVNTVDDSIVITDYTRSRWSLPTSEIFQYGRILHQLDCWLEHYWYKQIV